MTGKTRIQIALLLPTVTDARSGNNYLGVLGLMDTPRAAAKDVIARLRTLGIRRMILLSGDNQQVATAAAQEIGFDGRESDLTKHLAAVCLG